MNFLLDTNAIADWAKPIPNPGLVAWLADIDEDRLFLSVMTFAELRQGVERLVHGRRRAQLESWLQHDLPDRFDGRVLAINTDTANAWGRVVNSCQAVGRPIGVMDAFLAATVQVNGLTLVTHNTTDFDIAGVLFTNPWTA